MPSGKSWGKASIEEDDDDDEGHGGGAVESAVSTTAPDARMFVKGEHEQQMAYEVHTACDSNGFVFAVEVTSGNVYDSVTWDNEKGRKLLTTHIWQAHLDLMEQLRKTRRGKALYTQRKKR